MEIGSDFTENDKGQECTTCKKSKTTSCTKISFLKSVSIWINKPHVVNRRLCGSKIVNVLRRKTWNDAAKVIDFCKSTFQKQNGMQANSENLLTGQAKRNGMHADSEKFTDLANEKDPFTVIVRELIPKSEFFPKLIEAVLYDNQKNCVHFIPLGQDCRGETQDLKPTEELQYTFALISPDDNLSEEPETNEIDLQWSCDHEEKELPRRQITSKWLGTVLLDKLVTWSQVKDVTTTSTSLQLVQVDRYKETYVRLKNTYGRDLVKNWTERTDPEKFVYEDIAIAAYLLLLWEEDSKQNHLKHKQSFVDLGCGNGLLVYILTKEGHKGLGIDLKKRNIWNTFGPDIELKEQAIKPSDDHLYPDYDWIIGNHSDELTPWIPVIAARSSYNTKFFLLPCCLHDFVGKFGATDHGESRHRSYMEYVNNIIENCGFFSESDSLRIPSTKRMCFIGRKRSYEAKDESQIDIKRQEFIDKRILLSRGVSKPKLCKLTSEPTVKNEKNTEDSEGCKKADGHEVINSKDELLRDKDDIFSREEKCGVSTITSQKGLTKIVDFNRDKHNIHSQIKNFDVVTLFPCHEGKEVCDNLNSADSGFCDEVDFSSMDECKIKHNGEGSELSVDLSAKLKSQTSDRDCSHLPSSLSNSEALHPDVSTVSSSHDKDDAQYWVRNFKPRTDPGIRNCQKVPDEIKSRIVKAVFKHVLSAPDSTVVSLNNGKEWKKGGIVPLTDIATLFDKSTLLKLKNECGGLQTLLRNHSHVFQVTGGQVQLRDFTSSDPWKGCMVKKIKNKNNQRDNRKTTRCYFDAVHPDGCPRDQECCLFAHRNEELKNKFSRSVPVK